MNRQEFRRGIRLFNRGEFFAAHEVLEDVWRAAPSAEKKFLQGLIQIAVAFVHYGRANLLGARSLLARGSRNLSLYGDEFAGVAITPLLQHSGEWQNALEHQRIPPAYPTISLSRKPSAPGC